jgi:hypothetical protein
VTALTTAVAGHALGGAGLPESGGIVLAALALVVPAWWLARDERGWERLAAAQLAFQLAAHLLFQAVDPAMADHEQMAGAGPGFVLIAHLVSATVAATWLRSGERHARALSERALRVLFSLVETLVLGARARTTTGPVRRPGRADRRAVGIVLRHTIVHRGPPLFG